MVAFADCVIDGVDDDRLRREGVGGRERQLHGDAGAVADIDLRIGRDGDDTFAVGTVSSTTWYVSYKPAFDDFRAAERFGDSHVGRRNDELVIGHGRQMIAGRDQRIQHRRGWPRCRS